MVSLTVSLGGRNKLSAETGQFQAELWTGTDTLRKRQGHQVEHQVEHQGYIRLHDINSVTKFRALVQCPFFRTLLFQSRVVGTLAPK